MRTAERVEASPEESQATAAPALRPATRLDGIDLVRGAVMVLMLLDHTRDYVHSPVIDPLDDATTTPLLYLTRWITHLCAPTFVLLAGVSVGLQLSRGAPPATVSRFLWTRGLWLVFLELAVVRPLVWFNLDLSMVAFLQVIWATGVAMVVLAALVFLPARAVGLLGLAIVAGHNLLDAVQVPAFTGPGSPAPTAGAALWMLVHQTGAFPFGPGMVFAFYPVLPWVGVLACGVGAAELFSWEPVRRRRTLVAAALGFFALFVALRLAHGYGDPLPWGERPTFTRTLMTFFNVQKYGPSLQFLLVTLPLPLLLLAAVDGRSFQGGLAGALVIFGRVPLFFYLLQWLTAHSFGVVVAALRGVSVRDQFLNLAQLTADAYAAPAPLWVVYVCWGLGTALLWFPCRWYAGLKGRRRDVWLLRYL